MKVKRRWGGFETYAESFWSRVAAPNESGCRLWKNKPAPSGYAQFRRDDGKAHFVHRTAWELTNGPIPDGLLVCHRCDVRLCCEPAHLFLGTYAENSRDMVEKARSARGEKHGRRTKPERTARGARNGGARLTEEQARAVLAAKGSGESQESVGARFGVSQTAVSRIWNGRTWSGPPVTGQSR